jgi:hypothetical protein
MKDCWHCVWTGLDHPKLLGRRVDEYVKARPCGECDRAVRIDRIGSDRSGRTHNRAVYADGGKRTDERSISIEIDAFYDRFRLRNTTDDVPSMRGETVRRVCHARRCQRWLSSFSLDGMMLRHIDEQLQRRRNRYRWPGTIFFPDFDFTVNPVGSEDRLTTGASFTELLHGRRIMVTAASKKDRISLTRAR